MYIDDLGSKFLFPPLKPSYFWLFQALAVVRMVMEQKMQLRLECLVNIRLPREMVALLFCVARCRLRDYILNWTFNEVTALQRSPVSIVIICCLCFSFLHPISRLSVWSVIYEYKQCMFICYYNFLSLHCYCYECMAWNGPLLYLVNCLISWNVSCIWEHCIITFLNLTHN